jgi:hypothetical protein
MPVPQPHANEAQQDFVSRCMGDKTMVADFKQEQRAAVCYQTWRDRHKTRAKSALAEFRDELHLAGKVFDR